MSSHTNAIAGRASASRSYAERKASHVSHHAAHSDTTMSCDGFANARAVWGRSVAEVVRTRTRSMTARRARRFAHEPRAGDAIVQESPLAIDERPRVIEREERCRVARVTGGAQCSVRGDRCRRSYPCGRIAHERG